MIQLTADIIILIILAIISHMISKENIVKIEFIKCMMKNIDRSITSVGRYRAMNMYITG